MIIIDARTALTNIRRNSYSQWSGYDTNSPGSNISYAARRLQARAPNIATRAGFKLERQDRVYAIGSCFAREIEAAMISRGVPVPSFNINMLEADLFDGPHPWSLPAFFNRYTTASMLREVQNLTGNKPLGADELIYEANGKCQDLHYGNSLQLGSRDLLYKRRAAAFSMGSSISTADLIVITLGLIESWFDKESESYMLEAPPPNLLRNKDRFELRVLDFAENLDCLNRIYDIIKSHNSKAKFLITVSPVPLHASFVEEDIIVANMNSKSVLRAVAGRFAQDKVDADYFPSYERVMYADPDYAWKSDRRHVTDQMVQTIVDAFVSEYISAEDQPSHHDLCALPLSRVRFVTPIEDGCRISSGEVHIHPVDRGSDDQDLKVGTMVIFSDVQVGRCTTFRTGVAVGHANAMAVSFSVAVSRNGVIYAEASADVCFSSASELELNLTDFVGQSVDIVLRTRMAKPDTSSRFAWAYFASPRLFMKPSPEDAILSTSASPELTNKD